MVLHIFFNSTICDLVLLFQKIISGHPFHYLLIKMFWFLHANRQGLPESFGNLIFNIIYLARLSLCIFNALAVVFVKWVLTNFAKFTENT